jgi:hypothetical protein
MDLGEVGWGDVDWIGLAKDRNRWRALVNSVSNLRVPLNAENLSSKRRMWVDNIRMDLGEVGWGDMDRIGVAQDRNRWRALVNSVSNLRVP